MRGGRLIGVGPANNPLPNPAATNGFNATVIDFKRPPALLPSVTFIAASLNADCPGILCASRCS
jgi:predicted membrane-bound mannosyltransferase